MRKIIVAAVLALMLVVSAAVPAFAASSDTVTVTATPIYLTIDVSPATEALGNLAENSTTWAYAAVPADPLGANCTFTTTNNSSVAVNISLSATNFSGGVTWTLASTVGADQVVMKAGTLGTAKAAMVVVTTSAADNPTFHSNLASGAATEKWEFSLETGTFTDGVAKESTITLQATEV